MPGNLNILHQNNKLYLLYIFAIFFLICSSVLKSESIAYEGIETFYIRYDVKSSKNKIVDDNLMMTPAKNEFRAEKFSQIIIKGVISSTHNKSEASEKIQIKEDALKSILVKNGLKSIKTKDYETIISYEGVIITPVKIISKVYNKERNNYSYKVQLEFSPIAFPERWDELNMKYKIKKILYNFFELINP